MAIHVSDTTLHSLRNEAAPLAGLAGALGWELKDLGGDRFGLCPAPDRCVPVPEAAIDGDDLRLDHAEALAALGLVAAHDAHHTVLEVASTRPAGLGAGDVVDLSLPDVHTGLPTPLVKPGRPTAIYAWASW